MLAQLRGLTRNAAMRLFALVCGRAYTLPDQAKLAFPNGIFYCKGGGSAAKRVIFNVISGLFFWPLLQV